MENVPLLNIIESKCKVRFFHLLIS